MNERLKKLRKELGLNQTEFTEKMGLKQSMYSKYEKGHVVPRDSVIRLICQTYSVSENWLRTGIGNMFSESKDQDLILETFSKLTESNKKYLVTLANAMLEEQDSPTDEGG